MPCIVTLSFKRLNALQVYSYSALFVVVLNGPVTPECVMRVSARVIVFLGLSLVR